VIMIFTHRATDVTEKYALRVDVTGEYPFLFTKFRRCFEGE
jgi:PatG C-terminal